MIADVASAVLIVLGTLLTLVAALGLVRLPDFFARGHAATKGATLGLAVTLSGAAIQMSNHGDVAKLALAVIAQFLTAPVASHLLGRTAHRTGIALSEHTVLDELVDEPDPTFVAKDLK
ncbi:MAG: monovalent cation/H(+) antiporter subunit G [Ilumatobacteraceae bacterium]|nr:monovalent cation/H(+) antiporter subunit G [Ilumatobacteraceae bacterium]